MIFKSDKMVVDTNSSKLTVPDDYPTIQEAINNAKPGDTIFVRKGIYDGNIIINKSITLVGEDRENTIIDSKAIGNAISIRGTSNVTINGFTVKNSYPVLGCGIFIDQSENVVVCNNTITSNGGAGIQITFCSNNQIYENVISANYMGIQIFYSSSNIIYRNAIFNNTCGINIGYYSVGNIFYENAIYDNNWGVYLSLYSDNNVFYHNNFISNVYYNAYSEQTVNIWCYVEGNYWDEYKGKDLNKDGIGDVPYNITGKNVDYYPLMGRYYTFAVPFKGENYHVAIVSNLTISNFTFKVAAELQAKIILFNVSSTGDSAGFSRVAIPKGLMEKVHIVLVNEEQVNATLLNVTDVKNNYLYIESSGNCSIKIVYLELLDLYYQLLDRIYSLNVANEVLVEKFNALNETLHDLLRDWSDFQGAFFNMSASYQDQARNFEGLKYIFAATTATFIITTVYLSMIAHDKQKRIIKS
jgi:parallel beta-helix repeat protein